MTFTCPGATQRSKVKVLSSSSTHCSTCIPGKASSGLMYDCHAVCTFVHDSLRGLCRNPWACSLMTLLTQLLPLGTCSVPSGIGSSKIFSPKRESLRTFKMDDYIKKRAEEGNFQEKRDRQAIQHHEHCTASCVSAKGT